MTFDRLTDLLTPDVIYALRWATLVLVFAAFAALAVLFNRTGTRIKSDADTKPPPDVSLPGSFS